MGVSKKEPSREELESLARTLGLPRDVTLADLPYSEGEPEGMLVAMLTDLATTHGVAASALARIPWNDLARGMLEMQAIDPDVLRIAYLRYHAGYRGDLKLDREGATPRAWRVGEPVTVDGTPGRIAVKVPPAILPEQLVGLDWLVKDHGPLTDIEPDTVRAYPSYLIQLDGQKGLRWPKPSELS